MCTCTTCTIKKKLCINCHNSSLLKSQNLNESSKSLLDWVPCVPVLVVYVHSVYLLIFIALFYKNANPSNLLVSSTLTKGGSMWKCPFKSKTVIFVEVSPVFQENIHVFSTTVGTPQHKQPTHTTTRQHSSYLELLLLLMQQINLSCLEFYGPMKIHILFPEVLIE